MDDLRSLYEDVILDHNRNPRNYPKVTEGHTHHAHGDNPLCGDELDLYIKVKDNRVVDVGFTGAGCAISTASASLMTERLIGMTLEETEELFKHVHKTLTTETQDESTELLGKLTVLTGVKEYPMRVKCATLAWHTMHAALAESGSVVTTE